MNIWPDFGVAWFADYYLLSSLLLSLVLVVCLCIRQPARRIAVAWSTTIALLVMALLVALPGWSVLHLFGPLDRPAITELQPAASHEPLVDHTKPPVETFTHAIQSNVAIAHATSASNDGANTAGLLPMQQVAEVSEVNWDAYLLVPLVLGSVVALSWLLIGAWRTHRLVRLSLPATAELEELLEQVMPAASTNPLLRLSRQLSTGVALGLWRPTILLPQTYASGHGSQSLRSLLAHELAHLRNGDIWLLAMLRLLMVLLWANPLYWLTRRRVRLDQEMVADAAAALHAGRSTYAEQLVGWARELDANRPPTFAGAVGLWETKSQLRKRISVLLDEKLTILRDCTRRWRLSAVALSVAAAIGLSLVTMQPASLAEGTNDASHSESQSAFDEALSTAPAKPPKASDDFSIGGQVVDLDGKPVAGAEVGFVIDYRTGPADHQHAFRHGFEATAVAGEDGRFAIPYDQSLRRYMGSVWAHAPGYSPSRHRGSTVVASLDKRDNLSIALTPAEATEFSVVDVDGKPVSGVQIIVEYLRLPKSIGWPVPKDWHDRLTAVSDDSGRARIASVFPDSVDQLTLSSPDVGRVLYNQNHFLNAELSTQAPHYTITVSPAGQVTGQWASSDTAAPKDTPLRLMTEVRPPMAPEPYRRWAGVWGIADVMPDDEGKFEVPAMAVGWLSASAELDESEPWRLVTPPRTKVVRGVTTSLEPALTRGVLVRGQIRKSDTKEGYEKFRLKVIHGPSARDHNDMNHSVDVITDADGWYEAMVPPGFVELRIQSSPSDYKSAEWWNSLNGGVWGPRREVPADKPSHELPPIDLVPALRIDGKLVDKNDLPLNDWIVFGYPAEDKMNSFAGVHTDSEGRFGGSVPSTVVPRIWKASFRDWSDKYDFEDKKYTASIKSNEPLVIQVDVDGQPAGEAEEASEAKEKSEETKATASDAAEPATVQIPAETLKVLVLDEQGSPVADAKITPSGLRAENDGSWYGWFDGQPGRPVIPTVTSDAFGYATLTYPKYIEEQRATHKAIYQVSHADFIDDNKELEVNLPDRQITLKRGGRIEVSAELADGSVPTERLFAIVRYTGDEKWRTVAPGKLQSPVLTPEKASLRIAYLPQEGVAQFSSIVPITPVVGETQSINVTLQPGTRLEGKLDDSVPRPVFGGHVVARVDGPLSNVWRDWTEIAEDGTFVFESLPRDRDEVVQLVGICDGYVSTPTGGYQADSGMLEPQTANLGRDTARHTLTMTPTAKCLLKFVTNDDKPVAGVKVGFNPNVKWLSGGSSIVAHPKLSSREELLAPVPLTWEQMMADYPYEVVSDEEGVATFMNLPPYAPFTFDARHDEFQLPITEENNRQYRNGTVKLEPGTFSEKKVTLERKGATILTSGQTDAMESNDLGEPVDPTTLTGIALGPDGEPLAGVRVDAWTWYPGNETETDEKGRFQLKRFDRQEDVQVEFTKQGYSPRHFIAKKAGSRGWVIHMDNRTWLEGTVIGVEGESAAGVEIRAERGPFENPNGIIGDVTTTVTTDSSGKYRLYLEPDTYIVKVRAPGQGVYRRESLAVSKGQQRKLDIDLKEGITFQARVLKSETQEPVEGITLWNWRHQGIEGSSDAEGLLEIPAMFAGSMEFNVTAVGADRRRDRIANNYARWWSPQASREHQRKSVRPAELQRNFDDLEFDVQARNEPVTIYVEECATISGQVVDPEGKPVAGATVAPANGKGNSITGDTRYSYTTADDGTFVAKLPASGGALYNLVAHDGKFGQWRNWANGVGEPFVTHPGQVVENVELRLTLGATVRGRVLDAQGNPAAYKRIRAAAFDQRDNRYYHPQTKTDENGKFELKFIRPGKHYIQAEPFWLQANQGDTSNLVDLKAGEVIADFEIAPPGVKTEKRTITLPGGEKATLPVEPRTSAVAQKNVSQENDAEDGGSEQNSQSIKIAVVDLDSEPIEGAKVRQNQVHVPSGKQRPKIKNHVYSTDDDGEAIVTWLGESRDLRLWVTMPGYVPQHAMWSVELQADGEDMPAEFIFSMSKGSKVGGVVKDESGHPVEGVKVEIMDATAVEFHLVRPNQLGQRPIRSQWLGGTTTDANGRWEVDNVPGDDDLVFVRPESEASYLEPLRLRLTHPDFKKYDAIDNLHEAEIPSIEELRDKSAELTLVRKARTAVADTQRQATPRTDFTLVIAKHTMLLDGKEFITWAEIEEQIAALPDPSKAYIHLKATKGGRESGSQEFAEAETTRLRNKFGLRGYSIGGLAPRTSFRYDQLETATDIEPDPAHAVTGSVVDINGEPVVGAEVVLIEPVDESIPYKAINLYLGAGKLSDRADEVVTLSEQLGKFTVYPSQDDVKHYLLVMHPEAGFALVKRQDRSKQEPIVLSTWASVMGKILPKEGMEQRASITTSVPEEEGWPEISITHYNPSRKSTPPGSFTFPCIPPDLKTVFRRGIVKPQGTSIALPTRVMQLKSGEKVELEIGEFSETEKMHYDLFESRQNGKQ